MCETQARLQRGLLVGRSAAGALEGSRRPSASASTRSGRPRRTAPTRSRPLAWWGAQTERIRLGTGIVQLSARTPAATAMAAITLDHLSGGRFILGLGASGPQVVEGWYGQPYPRPLERTREYVEIVRRIFARGEAGRVPRRVLPHAAQGGTGLGKALKSTVHPLRTDLPIYLAAEGPKNVALAAEIGDGWLPLFFSPKEDDFYRECLAKGFAASGEPARPSASRSPAASPSSRATTSSGAPTPCARPSPCTPAGWAPAAPTSTSRSSPAWATRTSRRRSRSSTSTGRKAEAAASIPLAMVEDVALVGPPAKIRGSSPAWRDTCITTFLVTGSRPALRELRREAILG